MLLKTKYIQLIALAGFVLPILADTVVIPEQIINWRENLKGLDIDTTKKNKNDSDKLKYPIKDNKPYEKPKKTPFDLEDPEVIKREKVYDPITGTYNEEESLAGEQTNYDNHINLQEYLKRREQQDNTDYFQNRSNAQSFGKSGSEYLVSDPVMEMTTTLTEEAMEKVRFAKGVFAPKGHMYYPIAFPEKIELEKE